MGVHFGVLSSICWYFSFSVRFKGFFGAKPFILGLYKPFFDLCKPFFDLYKLFLGLCKPFFDLYKPFLGLCKPFFDLCKLKKGLYITNLIIYNSKKGLSKRFFWAVPHKKGPCPLYDMGLWGKTTERFNKRFYSTFAGMLMPFFLLRLASNLLKSFSIWLSDLRLGEIEGKSLYFSMTTVLLTSTSM